MKSLTKYLTFNVPARMDFVHITHQVQDAVKESGVQEGSRQEPDAAAIHGGRAQISLSD